MDLIFLSFHSVPLSLCSSSCCSHLFLVVILSRCPHSAHQTRSIYTPVCPHPAVHHHVPPCQVSRQVLHCHFDHYFIYLFLLQRQFFELFCTPGSNLYKTSHSVWPISSFFTCRLSQSSVCFTLFIGEQHVRFQLFLLQTVTQAEISSEGCLSDRMLLIVFLLKEISRRQDESSIFLSALTHITAAHDSFDTRIRRGLISLVAIRLGEKGKWVTGCRNRPSDSPATLSHRQQSDITSSPRSRMWFGSFCSVKTTSSLDVTENTNNSFFSD